ncbi:hypothetical protein ASD81_23590 [Nocardioides sp. Root614]|nr:hypothetical protein ASD81_23590 [Nocardioides sp. Root614]KRA86116.1 hypothetical protein ASD84_23830 [Nocardioides sp. Root682]
MAVHALSAQASDALRAAPFTYEEVGATASGPQPGYGWLERSAPLIRRDFEGAANDLFMWRLHERSGLRVQASESPLEHGTVVLMRLGLGPVALSIPCRVVDVINEPTRRGFAYGTLDGHPECGEERFVLERGADGTITLTITAFSRPASHLARLGGPLSRRVQQAMTTRYLRALDRP